MDEQIIDRYEEDAQIDLIPDTQPTRRGYLSVKCGCGNIEKISENVIEDGFNWTMLIGEEHFLQLHCEKCGADLKMYIEEIYEENEFPKESNKE